MRIIALRTLREYWKIHKETEQPLKVWYEKVVKANWESSAHLKNEFGEQVEIIKGNRARFKIKGNDYRLVVAIDYKRAWVFIKFVGTHAEYDKINAETINSFKMD